jgi:hypothetical protein
MAVILGHVARAEAGIRQFLDIGSGIPTAGNTHEVAQAVALESLVVYAGNGPIVLAHARALLTGAPEGATAYIHADVRDTGSILREAAGTLDFSKPVAVMVLCVMQHVPDSAGPHQIVSRLINAVPPGSYLTMSDTTRDIDTEQMTTGAARSNARLGPSRFTPRSREEIAGFFDGLDLVDPALCSCRNGVAWPIPQPRFLPTLAWAISHKGRALGEA